MYCNCTDTLKVPECANSLFIGQITPDTDYWVHIQNITTGHSTLQAITSNGDGSITIDLTNPDKSYFNHNSFYMVYVTLPDSDERLSLLLGGQTPTCYLIGFEKYNTDITFDIWQLELS